MVLVIFGLFLQIPVRFRWTAQSETFFVVVVMVLVPGAYPYLLFSVLLVRL